MVSYCLIVYNKCLIVYLSICLGRYITSDFRSDVNCIVVHSSKLPVKVAKSYVLRLYSLKLKCMNEENTTLWPLNGAEAHTYFLCLPAPSNGHNTLFNSLTFLILPHYNRTHLYAIMMGKQLCSFFY